MNRIWWGFAMDAALCRYGNDASAWVQQNIRFQRRKIRSKYINYVSHLSPFVHICAFDVPGKKCNYIDSLNHLNRVHVISQFSFTLIRRRLIVTICAFHWITVSTESVSLSVGNKLFQRKNKLLRFTSAHPQVLWLQSRFTEKRLQISNKFWYFQSIYGAFKDNSLGSRVRKPPQTMFVLGFREKTYFGCELDSVMIEKYASWGWYRHWHIILKIDCLHKCTKTPTIWK